METEFGFNSDAFEDEGSSNQKFWKPQKDRVRIRLMPTPADMNMPWVVTWFHHNMPHTPGLGGVVCGKKNGGMCPICAHVSELYNSGDNENGGRRRAKPFYYANIVEMGDKASNIAPDKLIVETYRFGKQVHEGIRKAFYPSSASGDIDEISEVTDNKPIDITHPKTGYNIAISTEKTGSEKWNLKYSVLRAKAPSVLPEMKRLLTERPDLTQYVLEPDEAVLAKNYEVLTKGYSPAQANTVSTGQPKQSEDYAGATEAMVDDDDIEL